MEKSHDGADANVLQAYGALQKWATRINCYEYSIQVKRQKGKKLTLFIPDPDSLILIDASRQVLNGTLTPEEAMSALHTPGMRYKRDMVMVAGY